MANIDDYKDAMDRFSYDPLDGLVRHLMPYGNRLIGDIAGSNNGGYVQLRSGLIRMQAHRFAFYAMEGYLPDCIDHINGVRHDNRWLNIRGCTNAENGRNRGISSNNTSGYRGVSGIGNKWRGAVTLNGKSHVRIGFKSPEKANEWVVNKSKELYGEFYNEEVAKEVIR